MPVVPIKRDQLFKGLNQTYTNEEFEELCFEYGIELDDVTSERKKLEKELGDKKDTKENKERLNAASDEVLYNIEIPANRYDLLCYEGIVRSLNIFREKETTPQYKTITPAKPLEMHVKWSQTKTVRPFVVAAVLRNFTFNEDIYASFIDLQDKLHQNICRKRTLVAIGTHDLDTITGPFSYEALPAKDIKFVPLNKTEEFVADKLLEYFAGDDKERPNDKDKHLEPYVAILRDPKTKQLKYSRLPIIYDSKRTVLSLPPIINSDHSKIKLSTKNILIECTATDLTKAHIVLNTMVTMFSGYCSTPFAVEQVKIIYEGEGEKYNQLTPNLEQVPFECEVDYINTRLGIKLTADEVCRYLTKMCLTATVDNDNKVKVLVPPTRSDILHACDIMEDVGIAYGFNNIVRTNPKTNTVGRQNPTNQLSDSIRLELAMSGYTENLTLILCAAKEQSIMMNKTQEEVDKLVVVADTDSIECQNCRISLIPGLLKTLQNSITLGLPQQLFEVGDVIHLDSKSDVGASNKRHVCALYCSTSSGFELIHGVLDRLMTSLATSWDADGYTIELSTDSSFFPGMCADIIYKGNKIGVMGALHPVVLEHFKIPHPVSVLEFSLQPFL
jgi:phenylalanyl-tRNA synthetase beta chain